MIDISKYIYKYETHLHTAESSKCARSSAVDMMKALKEAGYSGTFISDHAWGGNTAIDRSLPWREWVEEFAKPYYEAKKWADENDFMVLFGYEAGFNATEFLIYGVSPEWLRDHEEFHDADIPKQLELVHEVGGIVVHAHPYRVEPYIPEIRLFPDCVDGVEGVNATHSSHLSKSHNEPSWNDEAIAYATKHNKFMTAGSDVHSVNLFGGGILTDEPMECFEDFKNLWLSDKMYLLTDGDRIYDRYGKYLVDCD